MEHADRLDRLHPLRRRHCLARARPTRGSDRSPREFVFLALVSIPLWLVFEVLQPVHRNWYYVGLPENFAAAGCSATPGRSRRSGRRSSKARSSSPSGAALAGQARQRGTGRIGWHRSAARPRPSCRSGFAALRSSSAPLMLVVAACSCRRVALSGGARVARLHLSARSDQRAARRGVADRRSSRRQARSADEPGAQRPAVRRAVGVLELLGARQVALHRSDHGEAEDLRDAAAGVSGLSGVRARMLHDVRVRPPARDVRGGPASAGARSSAGRSRCNFEARGLK